MVQGYLGGLIAHDKANKHYWNILDNGESLDLTGSQFSKETILTVSEFVEREKLFQPHAKTTERYLLLKERVQKFLENNK